MEFLSFIDIVNISGTIFGILGTVFAFLAFIKSLKIQKQLINEKKRQSKKVYVTLHYGSEKIKLPMEFRRNELTRAEVLGRIGMIPMKKKGDRFSIEFLNSSEFLKQINQITDGDGEGALVISCEKNEFEQFDLKQISKSD